MDRALSFSISLRLKKPPDRVWDAQLGKCGCFREKAQRLGVNDGDACMCHNPLGGVIVAIRPAVRLRVKALDLAVSTTTVLCIGFPLGCVVVEPLSDSVSCQCLRGNFGLSMFFFVFL
jgi:hypothetical protein